MWPVVWKTKEEIRELYERKLVMISKCTGCRHFEAEEECYFGGGDYCKHKWLPAPTHEGWWWVWSVDASEPRVQIFVEPWEAETLDFWYGEGALFLPITVPANPFTKEDD